MTDHHFTIILMESAIYTFHIYRNLHFEDDFRIFGLIDEKGGVPTMLKYPFLLPGTFQTQ